MSPSTPESRSEAVADVLNGANTADVAKEHGVRQPTVDRWVHEHHETGESLDRWAREQHQSVREQRESAPTTGDGRDSVRGAEEEEAPVATDVGDISSEDEAATAALLGDDEPTLAQTAKSRIDELRQTLTDLDQNYEMAQTGGERDQLLEDIADAEDELFPLVALCDGASETPEEDDPRVATEHYDDWEANGGAPEPADSSVPFLARNANDPYPSTRGSLSATVNDPNY